MADSTAPAAKAGIRALLTASAPLVNARVEWGFWGEVPSANDAVCIQDVDQIAWEWKSIGGQRLEERYRIAVWVGHSEGGNDKKGCEERWWAVVAAVIAAIRSDLTLGGAVRECRPQPRDQKLTPGTDRDLICTGFVDVFCTSRAI